MRKSHIFTIVVSLSLGTFAQQTAPVKKAKDTIKTEVISVTSSYIPTIADAFKLKKNPNTSLAKKREKKALQYQIFSAPVASTFIPKKGGLKGLDLGKKERVFDNYIALGYGNYQNPFAEFFIQDEGKGSNYGMYAQYNASGNSIETTPLNSDFSELYSSLFYQQKERNYLWKVGLNTAHQQYHWYGLPSLPFSETTLASIASKQRYGFYEVEGSANFSKASLSKVQASMSLFNDAFDSTEFSFQAAPEFNFSLTSLGSDMNPLELQTAIRYLSGSFANDYAGVAAINYSFLNLSVHPTYRFNINSVNVKLGTTVMYTNDMENSVSDFLVYPDVELSIPIFQKEARLFLGADGGLKMNSYQDFVTLNPFVSPTLFLTQTNTTYALFTGVKASMSDRAKLNLTARYTSNEDEALFIRNNSKSDGSTSGFEGYAFGNSFGVIYDDIKTFQLSGTLDIASSDQLALSFYGAFNAYTLENQQEAWNLPPFEGSASAQYTENQWYAGAQLFFYGSRKVLNYTGTFPSTTRIQTLPSYFDVNLNGGYHINSRLSAYVKVNNLFNTTYERFTNFNVMGFQLMAGLSYKFDF